MLRAFNQVLYVSYHPNDTRKHVYWKYCASGHRLYRGCSCHRCSMKLRMLAWLFFLITSNWLLLKRPTGFCPYEVKIWCLWRGFPHLVVLPAAANRRLSQWKRSEVLDFGICLLVAAVWFFTGPRTKRVQQLSTAEISVELKCIVLNLATDSFNAFDLLSFCILSKSQLVLTKKPPASFLEFHQLDK